MDQLWHRLWAAAPKVDLVVRRDLLIQSAQASMLTNVMGLGLLVVVLITMRHADVGRGLAVWTGVILLNTVVFHVGVRWHTGHGPVSPERVRRQQLTMGGFFAVCGLAWGSLGLLALPDDGHASYRAITGMAVIIAMVANIAFASATPVPFLAFHLALTIAASLGLYLGGSYALAEMTVFTFFAALPLQRDLYLQISGAKLTARRNHLLAEELRGERAAVEQTNLRLVEANVELSHRATRDPLTGLANRALFFEHLAATLIRSRETGRSLSVIYFDLDRFKLINDTLGHAAGDDLLRQIGPRIGQVLRESDVLARLGGDEFVVLTMSGEEPTASGRVAEAVAERIRAGFEIPFILGDRSLRVSPSLGVAHDDGTSSGEQLVAQADAALYRAKELGRNRVATFDRSLQATLRERAEDGHVLRRLFASDGEVEARFDPVLDLDSGVVVAAEVTISLTAPGSPGLTPRELRQLAGRTGLTAHLDEELLRQRRRLPAEFPADPAFPVFARIGRTDLGLEDLGTFLRAEIGPGTRASGTGVGGGGRGLGIMLGERQIVSDPVPAGERIQAIRDLGVGVLLDGFGRGVSSMSMLATLPVDGVRLDPSLSQAGASLSGRAMLAGVVELSRRRGLIVIATGVESAQQAEQLRAEGIAWAQGPVAVLATA